MKSLQPFMIFFISVLFSATLACAQIESESRAEMLQRIKLEDLGRSLFFDVNLSQQRTQSCATCHDPAQGFIDWRKNGVSGAASMGADMSSVGDRNAPTVAYASFSPEFHLNADGEYAGGQFLDGREPDLAGQAGGPPLNPLEMAMPDKASVVARLEESPVYQVAFKTLFGEDVFTNVEAAYRFMTESLAAFERSDFFSPFDSKYDRYLSGSYQPTDEEELGMTLFFSEQFTNCNQCHQLNTLPVSEFETFSNYGYNNIGIPINKSLREVNGLGESYRDYGLLDNPQVNDPAQAGKFKVPTLRNVALTAPYMHNGIFNDLTTVIKFYNKYNARSTKAQINPETGEAWGEPEISENIDVAKLEIGPALDDVRIDALVAFMEMLTDKRYEAILDAQNK